MSFILDTARSLILEKGHEQFSMRELARRADYSPAGLYEYCKSKQELIKTLAVRVNNRLFRALVKIPETQNLDYLISLCRAYLKFALNNREDYLLLFATLSSGRKGTDEPVSRESAYYVVFQAVKNCLEKKIFLSKKGIGAEGVTYGIWALLHGQVMLQLTHLRNFRANFPQIDEYIITSLILGLRKQ